MLKPTDYKFRPERLMLFHIEAYDWNCPQHIHPKYSIEEVEEMLAERERIISDLKNELVALKKS